MLWVATKICISLWLERYKKVKIQTACGFIVIPHASFNTSRWRKFFRLPVTCLEINLNINVSCANYFLCIADVNSLFLRKRTMINVVVLNSGSNIFSCLQSVHFCIVWENDHAQTNSNLNVTFKLSKRIVYNRMMVPALHTRKTTKT